MCASLLGDAVEEFNTLGILLQLHIGLLDGRTAAFVQALPLHLAHVVHGVYGIDLYAEHGFDSLADLGLVCPLIDHESVGLVCRVVVALLGEYGADDYITKPYALAIVKVHIEAILKRAGKQKERVEVGHIAVEPDTWRVYVDEKAIETTPKEYELLSYLIKNKNVVMTRDSILESVWGYDYSGDTRTVDTLVKQLRRKIAPYGSYIRSVYGVGYIFEGEENETAEA